jgi:hypothetical protein
MNSFNPVNQKDANASPLNNAATGSRAQGSSLASNTPAVSKPDVMFSSDVAQRIAAMSQGALPYTMQLLEDVSSDVSFVESVQAAAKTLNAPQQASAGFDMAGISAALETLKFAREQSMAYAEKMREALPSLKSVDTIKTVSDVRAPEFQASMKQLVAESGNTIDRLAALAEEVAARNQRIAERSVPADNVPGRLKAQSGLSLQVQALPQEGQSKVARLLQDLGMGNAAKVSASSESRANSSAVNNLVQRLEQRLNDSNNKT